MVHPYDQHWDTPEFIEDWRKSQAESDECSSGPLKWLAKLWKRIYSPCCCQHDFDYAYGWKYGMTRLKADKELWECVKSASGETGKEYHLVALLMFPAVKLFGSFWYVTGIPGKIMKEIDNELS